MNDNEISKILAEFEFECEVEITGNHVYKANWTQEDFINDTREIASRYYLEDFNTILKLWNKLEVTNTKSESLPDGNIKYSIGIFNGDLACWADGEGKSIQDAAVNATVSIIQKIK